MPPVHHAAYFTSLYSSYCKHVKKFSFLLPCINYDFSSAKEYCATKGWLAENLSETKYLEVFRKKEKRQLDLFSRVAFFIMKQGS